MFRVSTKKFTTRKITRARRDYFFKWEADYRHISRRNNNRSFAIFALASPDYSRMNRIIIFSSKVSSRATVSMNNNTNKYEQLKYEQQHAKQHK